MLITKKVTLTNPSFHRTYSFDNEQNVRNQNLIIIPEEKELISTYIVRRVYGRSFFPSKRHPISNFQRHGIIHSNINIQCYFYDMLTRK